MAKNTEEKNYSILYIVLRIWKFPLKILNTVNICKHIDVEFCYVFSRGSGFQEKPGKD